MPVEIVGLDSAGLGRAGCVYCRDPVDTSFGFGYLDILDVWTSWISGHLLRLDISCWEMVTLDDHMIT